MPCPHTGWMRGVRVWYRNVRALARVPGPGRAWHRRPMAKLIKPAGPAPTRASLHEAALRHLARFAATEAGMVRVLDRKVQRWARTAEGEGQAVSTADSRAAAREVARALVSAGMIDDAGFAAARGARLVKAGRSRRAASAHLVAKGVDPETAGAVLSPEAELPASLVYARKRRIGPFRAEATSETRLRDLGALARAGFPRDVAERALALDLDQATELVLGLKRG